MRRTKWPLPAHTFPLGRTFSGGASLDGLVPLACTTPGRRRGPECAASTHGATAAALGARASHQGPQVGPALALPRVRLACLLETQGSSQGSGVILGVC